MTAVILHLVHLHHVLMVVRVRLTGQDLYVIVPQAFQELRVRLLHGHQLHVKMEEPVRLMGLDMSVIAPLDILELIAK